jgi:hypothetical protein
MYVYAFSVNRSVTNKTSYEANLDENRQVFQGFQVPL